MTLRTGNVSNYVFRRVVVRWGGRCAAEKYRLLFTLAANIFKRCDLEPNSATTITLAHRLRSERERRHVNDAARTFHNRKTAGGGGYGRSPAMWTVLTAKEHHREACWTRDGRELRFAITALRRVR